MRLVRPSSLHMNEGTCSAATALTTHSSSLQTHLLPSTYIACTVPHAGITLKTRSLQDSSGRTRVWSLPESAPYSSQIEQ